jgi:hypothetical protein
MPAALKLRAVSHPKGDANQFCGPSAISALTGMSSGEAARLLRHVTRRKAIKGASTSSVQRALALCGVRQIDGWNFRQPTTLAAWLRSTAGTRGGRIFLIVAGNHFQVVSGNRYVCGRTGAVVGLDDPKVKRRARMDRVMELDAPSGVTIPAQARKPVATPGERKRVSSAASAARRARKLAAEYGIEIDRHTDLDSRPWWVSHPDLDDTPDDPHDGDHYVHSWEDVLERVEDYVAALAKADARRSA